MASEQIRFGIRSPALQEAGFTPNAVVTLEKVPPGTLEPEQILRAQFNTLEKRLNLDPNDVVATPVGVCGFTGLKTVYTAPAINDARGQVASRRATSVAVVYESASAQYVATVTVQTVNANNPSYVEDLATILDGFQVLSPPR